MEQLRGAGRPSDWSRAAFRRGMAWIMTHSLIVYVFATLAERAWALLNTDLAQLIPTGPPQRHRQGWW